MDEMVKYVEDVTGESHVDLIQELSEFLRKEEYDTEAVRMDLEIDSNEMLSNCNINEQSFGTEVMKVTRAFVRQQKC